MELDSFDRAILRVLMKDGRASAETVAEAVGLSPTPTRRRIRRLERDGIITGYRAEVDPEKCGLSLTIYVLVTLNSGADSAMDRFEQSVRDLDEVQRCDLIAGPNCYLLTSQVADMQAYNQFLRSKLVNLPDVYAVESRIVIGAVKNQPALTV